MWRIFPTPSQCLACFYCCLQLLPGQVRTVQIDQNALTFLFKHHSFFQNNFPGVAHTI